MNSKTIKAIREAGRIADMWLPWKIRYDRIPGLSLGIFHGGKLVFARGYGFSDIKKKTKASPETLYHVASHSKMFTAAAVMKLVDAGTLRLDDKASDYVPWLRGTKGGLISVRELVSHTSGLVRDGVEPFWSTGKFPKSLDRTIIAGPVLSENAVDFKYANFGYAVLGQVIEAASGMTYKEFMDREIFKPLGLRHTFVDYENGIKNAATGYGPELPGVARKVFPHAKANAYAPATGFVSTVGDIAAFLSIFSAESAKLLSSYAKRQMTYPWADTGGSGRYGLGLIVDDLKGRKAIGHGGGYGGYITKTIYEPKSDVGVVVLTNSVNDSAGQIAYGIADMVHALMNETAKVSRSRYEGVYRDTWGDEIVAAKGQKLIVFSPETNNPFSTKRSLSLQTKPGMFVAETSEKYSVDKERGEFRRLRNGKYQEIFISGSLAKRIG